MGEIGASEAMGRLPDRAEADEEVVINRRGKGVAKLVLGDRKIKGLIAEGRM